MEFLHLASNKQYNMRLFFYTFLLLQVHSCFSRTLSKLGENDALPIKTNFQLPSPLPTWSQGGGFGSGVIDLGGLQVRQVSNLNKVWTILEGGPNNQGVTFFEPSSIRPDGFFILGFYSQPNNSPLFGWVLVAKDLSPDQDILKNPIDYTLVWSSKVLNINQQDVGYIWLPTAPDGYKAVGLVVTNTPQKPSLDKVRCVRADFTDEHSNDQWIWGSFNGLKIHNSKPSTRGPQGQGVFAGTFVATLASGAIVPDACLKNIAPNSSNSMPTIAQIRELVAHYSPRFYFHPNEKYFPSGVTHFFVKGGLLYTRGQESTPVTIGYDGENLPQGGSNDGAYWIDLPNNDTENARQGDKDFLNPRVYVHAKPALGETHTDLAIWVFYPFNGPAVARVWFFNIGLGRIGQHVGDWEHVTLRINNFNGALERVYFSQHGGGTWVDAPNLEYLDGNKVVVYPSLHGHAAYPDEGDHIKGGGKFGIRNDAKKGDKFLDTDGNYEVFSTVNEAAFDPPWLNYAREWGPKIQYSIDNLIEDIDKHFLPWFLKKPFEKFIRGLPTEILCEQGPTGPKWKGNWDGDETANGDLGPCFHY